jgi:sugar lactone lactonase YvrE
VLSTISYDQPWQQVGESYGTVIDPTADDDGNVYFADPAVSRIYKADADGKVTLFTGRAATALQFGPDGRLYASLPSPKRIVSYGPAGDEKTVAEDVEATSLAATAKGVFYFSDPIAKTIGSFDATGHLRTVYQGGKIALPAGLALSPDQSLMVVTDAQAQNSWSFQIAADGTLINGEPFYRLEVPAEGWMSGVRAVAEDSIGQTYFATPLGVQICEANGRLAQILNPPEHGNITSVIFAGRDFDWLYVAENGKLFRRPVKVHGTRVTSPRKPPNPPL